MQKLKNIVARWSPGVLGQDQIQTLIEHNVLSGISKGIDLSSFDLHIEDQAYLLLKGCVRPFGESFLASVLKNKRLAAPLPKNSSGLYDLEKQHTYIFKLKEGLNFPGKDNPLKGKIYGIATGKSTIGRLDVLVRLIAEGAKLYDNFDSNYPSDLFLEVTPITFNVTVRADTALSQLRLFYGDPSMAKLTKKEVALREMLKNGVDEDYASLSVSLTPTRISSSSEASGFQAIPKEESLKLWKEDFYDPHTYWKPLKATVDNEEHTVILERNEFYILRSRELIALPQDVAVYCKAMDESLGEMRIHYAGFVHPNFGSNRIDKEVGTPLIFEVRGHNMDIVLRDQDTLAKLEFYRMSKPASIGEPATKKGVQGKYMNQSLTLSKLFKEWE